MSVAAIIQARMGSTRLPGKVMLPLNGAQVLSHVIARLKHCKTVDNIIVATTKNAIDDEIANFVDEEGVDIFRGSELNVLARYYHAAKECEADVIVRICSDCPLLDSTIIDEMVMQFKKRTQSGKDIDYISNAVKRSFPRGLDAEVFSFYALEKAYQKATKDFEKVHVTPFIYQNIDLFSLYHFVQKQDESGFRWTLDTQKDYTFLQIVFTKMGITKECFPSTEKIIAFLRDNPELLEINKEIEQKQLHMC